MKVNAKDAGQLWPSLLLVLSVMLSACTTTSPVMTGAQSGPLYPPGVYQHNVTIEFNVPRQGQKMMSMKGIVTLSENGAVNVTGLSPFSTTVFRLKDSGRAKPTLEIYDERMKPLAPSLVKRYLLIKQVLEQKRENLQTKMRDADGGAVEVLVTNFDKKGIPRLLNISGTQYKIRIEVTDYELQKSF